MAIRIVLADDHKVVREGIRALIEKEADIEVVGEADNGLEAIRLIEEKQPDIILLDIAMPDLNGLEVARRIKENWPRTRIIALSAHESSQYVLGMINAGSSGYLLKDVAFGEVRDAIRTVSAGEVYLSSKVAGTVVDGYLHKTAGTGEAVAGLSDREREVLQLLAEGHTTKEIAAKLFISIKTVEVHRWKLMKKLGLRNIAELIKFAIREGITTV